MDRSSFAGQVLAVVFRRAPAFRPEPGEPTTFAGRISALRGHRAPWGPGRGRSGIHSLPPRTLTVRLSSYSELRSVGEAYREGNAVLMDVSQLGETDAKRSVDFAAGLIFGTRGSISREGDRMFLLRPPRRWGGAIQSRSAESVIQDALADWVPSG